MQHIRKQNGGKLIWDTQDWVAGLGAQGNFSVGGSNRKMTDQAGWQNLVRIDPFTLYGILSPGLAPNAYTNSNLLNGVIVAGQVYSNTLALGVSSLGTVHQMSYITSTPSITNAGTFPHLITGTDPVGQDCLLYTHNSSGSQVTSLFYSYYINANWNVGADVNLVSGAGTFDDDFMSSVPATPLDITSGDGDDTNQRTQPHPLAIGSDGNLYIGSGRYLHAYDGSLGTNGTFSSKVLTLPQGFQIIAMRKYNDTLLIAGNYYSNGTSSGTGSLGTGEALVYVWNYIDLDVTQIIPLEDSYVSALFIYRGSPTVITSGISERNGPHKIKVITGISTTKLADFDGIAPVNRGILVADDVLYMNAGGSILTYGDKYNRSSAINHLNTCSVSGVSGWLAYNYTNSQLMASSSAGSTTAAMNNFGDAGTSSGSMFGFSYELDLPNDKRARVTTVRIKYYAPVTANVNNGTFSINLITDYGVGNNNVINAITSLAAPLTKKYKYTSTGGPLPTFTSIALQIIYTASTISGVPLVSRLEIDYEDLDLPANTQANT